MIPSARSIEPPNIAIHIKYFFFLFLLIKANKENIPPSPLLSACRVIKTYFIVVNKVIVQKTAETPPKINSLVIICFPIMALITYKGDVPISP